MIFYFKDKLKQLRKDNNLTQEALANIICVSRSAINKWGQGIGIPSNVNLKSLCEYFKVSEEWLLDREDLKEYIKIDKNFKKKSMIISLVGIILPIIVYTITLSVSFINIIQVVKEAKKLLIINLIFIFVSLLIFITTFVIASFIASQNSYGLII